MKAAISGAVFVLLAGAAVPKDLAGTNMAAYPDPACRAPKQQTLIQPDIHDIGGIDVYNQKIRNRNLEANQYDDCIRTYIDDANNDLKRIQDRVNREIEKANAPQ